MNYIEVILPLPLRGTFTYSLPNGVSVPVPGVRVIVPFGKRKIYTGIVYSITVQKPEEYQPKEILELVDESPVFTETQLVFLDWMASYYMATLGEAVNAALPSGLKISSESYVSLNPDIEEDALELSEKEQWIVSSLRSSDLTLDEISKLLNIKSAHHHIKKLSDKNIIHLFEKIKDKYTPKTETRLRLNDTLLADGALEEVFANLEKKPKQTDVLLAYLKLSNILESPAKNDLGVSKKKLLQEEVSESSYKTLLKNGVLKEWKKKISRIPEGAYDSPEGPKLSTAQEQAKNEILTHFEGKNTVLLKGITGSGKTEVYISLIKDVLDNDGNVLLLLPEIALTTQIIKRLSRVFGDTFGVYHSRYSESERVEVWEKVLKNEYQFVVGVRSSVFLPYQNLSLVIVDEEHEPSYKQYEPAPRYHARDAAIYLAHLFHAKVLMGTATPAIESMKNALDGKYALVKLETRFREVALPEVLFADMVRERKRKTLKGNFSSLLLHHIQEALDQKEQVILFQNRRGYAPYIECDHCGFHSKCPQCDVSLTYHIHQNLLVCHYCGHKKAMITECPQCGSHDLRTMSFGTEKLEEELEILLPEARVQRMDLDSTRSKYSYQKIIDEFEAGNIDILIGTQMVSKGLDFDNVSLVGIFSADRMINFPDFRSHERAFQLIHQVSGRAGRNQKQGTVIVQSNDPSNPILDLAKQNNYEGLYTRELLEREQFRYPPFQRMIKISIKDRDKKTVTQAAHFLSQLLTKDLGTLRVIGPVEPLIARIRNFYLMDITIKFEKQGINLTALKEFLLNSRNILLNQRSYKSVKISFDVDPI